MIADFNDPPQSAKPVMIWQWMDGWVTKEGITHELEAYAAAGVAGVQNFQVGARIMEVLGSRDGTRLILFKNPGGEYVLVVACDGSLVRGNQRRRLVVKYKGLYKSLPLPGRQWSVSTLVFR